MTDFRSAILSLMPENRSEKPSAKLSANRTAKAAGQNRAGQNRDEVRDVSGRTELSASGAAPTSEFIERCQIEYQKNPASRVFAPLAEAYRKLGMLDEAVDIARRGVRMHPDFAAGRIAFARILIEKKQFQEALEQLAKATELSPDNLLAFQLMGETQIELKRPKDALNSFKMVLFLSPNHERALKMVKKWEFLTADDYDDSVFEWSKQDSLEELDPVDPSEMGQSAVDREARRALSIADALTVRNDLDGAFAVLGRALKRLGAHEDLLRRINLLGKRLGLNEEEVLKLVQSSTVPPAEKKRKKLEKMLGRLREKRT